MTAQDVIYDSYVRLANKIVQSSEEKTQPSTTRVLEQHVLCSARPHNSCSIRDTYDFINSIAKPKIRSSYTNTLKDNGAATVSTSGLDENQTNVKLLSSPKILRQVEFVRHGQNNFIARKLVYKHNDSENQLAFKNKLDCVNRHQQDGLYSLRSQAKQCFEKSTNCRAYNKNDQEFVLNTLAKNARLRLLVHKLVEARQREKESELGDKCFPNGYNNNAPHSDYKQKALNQESKNNIYVTRPYSRHVQLSGVNNQEFQQNCEMENDLTPSSVHTQTIPSTLFKLKHMETDANPSERLKKMCSAQSCYKNDGINKLESSSPIFRQVKYCQTNDYIWGMNIRNSKNTSIQTDFKQTCANGKLDSNRKEETAIEKYDRVSENVERLRSKLKTKSPLANIELKLDKLLNSINTFIVEFQARKSSIYKNRNYMNATQSEPYRLRRVDSVVCGMTIDSNSTNNSKNFGMENIKRYDDACKTEIEKNNTVLEEIENNKVTRDTDHEIVKKVNPCTVQRSKDPSDVKSTQYSMGEDKLKRIISTPRRIMNMAVNTDPLSILGLLRISKDTVKQLLSYMPSIDYYSYLPQTPRNTVRHYVCNICGAAFCRPAQLSDHITQAHAGNVRNCCTCRHALDRHHRSRLFSCRYCGQRFTRAYCCELHQQTCARRLGRRHDVSTSLMLLK